MQNPVGALAWSADGKTLAASANSGVYIFDTQTNSMIHSLAEGEFHFPLVIDPEGKRLLAGNQVWDITSGQLLYQLPQSNVSAAAFSPDGKTLATSGDDSLQLWDALDGNLLNSSVHKFEPGQWGLGLTYSADGNLLYANSSDNKVIQVDLLSGQVMQLFTLPEGSCCSIFSPDADYMVVNLSDHGAGSKQLWDVAQAELLQDSGNCDSDVSFSAISADSTRFILGCAFDSQLWSIPTKQLIHKFPFMDSLSRLPGLTPPIPVEWRSAAFNPDATQIAFGNNFGEILIWDVNTYQLINSLSIPLP